MKIITTSVEKIRIEDIMGEPHKLDPVEVLFEDIAPRQGKVTVTCYGDAWTAYWGGMGESKVKDFFMSCNDQYLAGKMFVGNEHIDDFEGLQKKARGEIIKSRKAFDITKRKARELYDECESLSSVSSMDELAHTRGKIMTEIFGDEWWHSVGSKTNPKFLYLCRIISAIKSALTELQPSKIAA